MRRHRHVDDCTQLLLRAQGGDSQAFADLYGALSPTVRDYVFSLNSRLRPQEREDMVQEVFLRVWHGLSGYRREASAKTFLLAVARNVLLKHLSERGRLPLVYTADLSYVPDRSAHAEPTGSHRDGPDHLPLMIQQAMAKLTDAQRRAVELDLADISRTAAAKLANCSPSQFADRLYEARKRLRKMLKGQLRRVWL